LSRTLVAPAGVLLAMLAASVLPTGHGGLHLALAAAFWVALLFTIAELDRSILTARWLLPLALAYFATFAWHRHVLAIPDYVFNTDTERYLREAAAHRIQVRHLGFPVITFAAKALGREAVIAQCAAAGALLVSAFDALQARFGARGIGRAAMTVIFAASLATWTMASLIESFVLSTLLLALALSAMAAWTERPETPGAIRLGLLILASLGVSLENAYLVPVIVAGALTMGRIPAPRNLALVVALPVAGLALWIPAVAASQGEGFYATWGDESFSAPAGNVVENLEHFSRDYVAPGRLLTPRSHVETLWRTFVLSVRGLSGEDSSRYPAVLHRAMFLDAGNVACAVLTAALATLSLVTLFRRARVEPRALRVLLTACAATLILRHVFLVVYAPTQSLLFSLPSLFSLDLTVAWGLARAEPRRVRHLALGAAVTLAALVAISNARVLVELQRDAPREAASGSSAPPPTANTRSAPGGRLAAHAFVRRSIGSISGSSVSWIAPQCIGTIAWAPSATKASRACSGFMWCGSMNHAGA